MPTTTRTPATARGLLALVEPFGPAVEGGQLVFAADLTADLEAAVSVLHTGLRSLLTRRPWWGSSARGATRPRVSVLSTDTLIPPWCGLLCVAGDARWERLAPRVRKDHPGLFAAPDSAGRTPAPLVCRPLSFQLPNRPAR